MAIDVKPEIPRAVLEGGKNPGATPAKKEAVRLFEEKAKVKGPRTATEEASASKIEADSKKAKNIINENIGAQAIDPVTRIKPRTSEEEGRFNTANNYEGMIAQFIKEGKGWSGLSDAQKNVLRPDITKEIKKWVNTDTSDYFSGKTDAEVNAIIDKFLTGDVDVFDKVKELYEARLVNSTESIGANTEDQSKEIRRLEKEVDDKRAERDEHSRHQAKNQKVVDMDFRGYDEDLNKVIGLILGSESKKILEIDKRIATDFTPDKVRVFRLQKASKEQELARLRENLTSEIKTVGPIKGTKATTVETPHAADIRKNMAMVESDLKSASDKLEEYNGLINDRKELLDNRAHAKTQANESQEKYNQADEELKALVKQKAVADAELASMKLNRADAEKAFVASVKNILPDAVSEVFMARVKPMEDAYQKTLDEIEANPNLDPYTKALVDGLRLRYDKFKEDHGFMHRKWWSSETTRVVDKDAIKEDNDELKNGGTDAAKNVMTRVLLKSKNPDTGAKYTQVEAEAFLAANPDFIDKHIETVTVGLITKGLQTGQVGAKDMEKMVQNGYISDEKMVETFTKSQAMKKKLEQAGVTDSMLKEMGKRVGNKKLWMWLALFALSPMVATGVGLFVVGKDMVKPGPKEHGDGKKDEGKKDEPETTPETPEAEA